ncbi:hypothetical protein LTR78_008900 [Recurvomyces mirabilis]|uniref:DUF7707 domain-containing protein n=1 Tax=Recurvomyces mirabilis TaxID=574656 RepID=A0AAE0TPU4_9PEZI|nr:hypothetical protein LTR78_008900 [Recurvomyces mirabilis]KAK5155815.1 hypothetical protein LTS14_005381 [Recurvomyces mirabilis]
MKASTTFATASAFLLSTAVAQSQYTIDPNSVVNTTRAYWCTQEQAQCPLICLQTNSQADTIANDCNPTSLTYSCVCSNGMSPNISEYTQTLPFFICQEWGNQCVSNCNGDSICQSNCRSQHPCGAQNPVRQNTSTLSSTMSQTGSATGAGASTTPSNGVYSGFGGGSAASSTGGGSGGSSATAAAAAATSKAGAASIRAAALNVGQTFGLLGVAGVLFGGFAILL